MPTDKKSIMLVDDQESITKICKIILRKLNFEANVFNSPIDAVEDFYKDPDAYDIIITDLNMPEMSGISFAEKLREIKPKIPIFIMTGASDAGIPRDMLKKLNVVGVISKPIHILELKKLLDSI